MSENILIADDDRSERRLVSSIMRGISEFNILEASNGKEVLNILDSQETQDIRLLLLDISMPIMDGLETLQIVNKSYPDIPVIIMTAANETKTAVLAMKMGAIDFLNKPIEKERLETSARNALKMSLMGREISRLQRHTEGLLKFSDLIGYNGGLKEEIKIAQKASGCALPVLITGETGTGKELIARAIHGESDRTKFNFVTVNCGAIPEKLVESTLFGHEKGAFTGAIQKSFGKFLEADGGTIFLDEIGELPIEAQVKLLRVLQQQEIEPVGASKALKVDTRIISATNRNLDEEVKKGYFREDLYFRLNVLHIDMPPLRKRREDIPAMADNFIKQFCAHHRVLPKTISTDAYSCLQNYEWPGNVRELENTVNRSMALSESNILDPDDFMLTKPSFATKSEQVENAIFPINPDGSFKAFKDLEFEIITMALRHHDNNVSKTARVLGIAKSTLYSKINHVEEKKTA